MKLKYKQPHTHTQNSHVCVFVGVCVCLCFSVYTEIKGSLRRWNCVCIEAFGSFSQRLLCCHGNACWTRVLWIFQKPPFSSDHLGSFHNAHRHTHTQHTKLSAVGRASTYWSKRLGGFSALLQENRYLTTETNNTSAVHAGTYSVCINAKRASKHHAC